MLCSCVTLPTLRTQNTSTYTAKFRVTTSTLLTMRTFVAMVATEVGDLSTLSIRIYTCQTDVQEEIVLMNYSDSVKALLDTYM